MNIKNVTQHQLTFFGPHDSFDREAPSSADKNDHINNVFSKFIGNEKALTKLKTAAFTALGRSNHRMSELSFSIFGPPSSGKTTLARLYAEVVELPFVEISPQSVKKIDDIFDKMSNACDEADVSLIEQEDGSYFIPPLVIFIDEVHALLKNVVQGLLKAIEHDDKMLYCEDGKVVDTQFVTWMIATTDEGMLFDAFRTRFTPVQLNYLTRSEISEIIQMKHRNFTREICDRIAFYNSRIPRNALQFSRYVEMYKHMREDLTWMQVVDKVAEEEGIDSLGMHENYLKILKALKDGPVAKSRISHITGKKKEENERYIMPWLLTDLDDQPALVKVTTKGYVLTKEGEKELFKRGL